MTRSALPETLQAETSVAVEAVALALTPVVVPLGRGRSVEVQPGDGAATLRIIAEGNQQLQIEIRFDAHGPVLRVEAPRLEVKSPGAVRVACDTFSVDASRSIDLRSAGDISQTAGGNARLDAQRVDVEASPGAIRLKANDEVQVLGEMILLNCEHPRTEDPMPAWTQGPRVLAETAAEPTSGDASVIAELLGR